MICFSLSDLLHSIIHSRFIYLVRTDSTHDAFSILNPVKGVQEEGHHPREERGLRG